MLILITGGCKNGKSDFAQRVCMELAEKRKKYYLATLHVRDAEDEKKVESHLKSRAGMALFLRTVLFAERRHHVQQSIQRRYQRY